MFLIDTNIFLEVLLAREKKEDCKRSLRLLRDGEEKAIVTDFAVHSIIVVMDGLNELRSFLLSLIAYTGLQIRHTTLSEEVGATELALNLNLDMDDAIQYSTALDAKVSAIVSYDRHFDGLEVPRIEPSPN